MEELIKTEIERLKMQVDADLAEGFNRTTHPEHQWLKGYRQCLEELSNYIKAQESLALGEKLDEFIKAHG